MEGGKYVISQTCTVSLLYYHFHNQTNYCSSAESCISAPASRNKGSIILPYIWAPWRHPGPDLSYQIIYSKPGPAWPRAWPTTHTDKQRIWILKENIQLSPTWRLEKESGIAPAASVSFCMLQTWPSFITKFWAFPSHPTTVLSYITHNFVQNHPVPWKSTVSQTADALDKANGEWWMLLRCVAFLDLAILRFLARLRTWKPSNKAPSLIAAALPLI